MIFTTQVVKSVTRSNIPEIPLKIHPKQWENGAYLVHICFLVCTHSVGLAVFWTEEDTNSSANHVTKGELECLPSVLWANVCGLCSFSSLVEPEAQGRLLCMALCWPGWGAMRLNMYLLHLSSDAVCLGLCGAGGVQPHPHLLGFVSHVLFLNNC